ncbi:hypothetical protein Metho_2502 (plasmid) [Methanomethylovorans hollandica DSM 15978]|jgi:hypothetical protein|uniref:N-acetyltransferase domain-containing protein n=1 Tax=Methanomethylovorans hollandica (strain DSM 15978 / NBRC 107637 / DMS1) TaxID=867904 RepID=L0KYV1_METHD|nr:GNAT family N-acetyltransferase [Methanomethylovorans hollandica]AGB50642.1 hypothetical protein Metho_2502 [Methanomethylovorans hollandica DSM 15978]
MNNLSKTKEGITAAKQIYSSPSFMQLAFDAFYPLISKRFSYASSVGYIYSNPKLDQIYIILLYSLQQRKGHSTETINQIKRFAIAESKDIVVTVSNKSEFSDKARAFYEKNGFECIGTDMNHYYYILKYEKIQIPTVLCDECSDTIILDKFSLREKTISYLAIVAYHIRMRNTHPIAIETMNKWIRKNTPQENYD